MDCSLIIGLHTQADLQTVVGQIPIDRGLPSLERVDTDHETNVIPLSEVVPGAMLYAVDHLPCCFFPVKHGQAECTLRQKMTQLMPEQYDSFPGLLL